MRICTAVVVAASSLFLLSTGSLGQDRLPTTVRSSPYLVGQLLGCTLRVETYYRQTIERAQAAGRTLPANYQIDLIAGLNVAALKADARQALLASSPDTVPIAEVETAIAEIAVLEYDASSVGAPGYSEAWGQALACSALFSQYQLYEAYR